MRIQLLYMKIKLQTVSNVVQRFTAQDVAIVNRKYLPNGTIHWNNKMTLIQATCAENYERVVTLVARTYEFKSGAILKKN